MKTKLFRRIIAGAMTIAMAAQFAFVLPASAKTVSKSFDFEDGNKVFSDDSRIAGAIEQDATLNSNVLGFTCAGNAQNGYSFAHYDFSSDVTGATQVKIELDYYNTNGGRAILSFGDASVRGNTGGSSKITYNKAGAAFNLGSDKSNGILMGGNVAIGDVTNKWMHVSVTMNTADSKLSYKITNKSDNAVIKEASDVAFLSSDVTAVTQIDLFGYINNSHCSMFDNIKIDAEISETALYKVTYNVDGTESNEMVFDGGKATKIPTSTEKTGYVFMGWTTDGDPVYSEDKAASYVTSEQIADTAVTAEITYTAVYERDAEYIEPMVSIEFADYPADGILIANDGDVKADNKFSVKAVGEIGTDLVKNPDNRVKDFDVKYTLKGMRWKNGAPSTDVEGTNLYCDGYGVFTIDDAAHTANLALSTVGFNFYGSITADVTYYGKTLSITKPVVYLGYPSKPASQILPRGGYVSDFNQYSPDMVGYIASDAGADPKLIKDAVTDNWVSYGGNTRKLSIASDEGGRFLRLEALSNRSSTFAATTIDSVKDSQVIFDQKIRFHSDNSSIVLKSEAPNSWKNKTAYSVTFKDSALNINGNKITDAATDKWYRLVVISDAAAKKCYAVVYDADGVKLGESEIADFTDAAGGDAPTFYMLRTPDNMQGSLDFNDVKIYRAEADAATFAMTSTQETMTIPEEEGAAASTAQLTADVKTTEGYNMLSAATWSVVNSPRNVRIEPSADDSHIATLTVENGASAGPITIEAIIGGVKQTKTITLTSSSDSVSFKEYVTSVTIPMTAGAEVKNTFKATVINGDGQDIAGKQITYALYDKNNANPTTAEGVTLVDGVLTVNSTAKPCTVWVRATSTNTDNELISSAIKVDIHGLSFDFGAGTDEDIADGYTPVTPTTMYSDDLTYGIIGTATAGGDASLTEAKTDYLSGTFKFQTKLDANKVYNVKITYKGSLKAEAVNADLTGIDRNNTAALTEVSYPIFVKDGILDLSFADSQVAAISIETTEAKTAREKPHVYSIGDSTIASRNRDGNGTPDGQSWALRLSENLNKYPELTAVADFTNNGTGGSNLKKYYEAGSLNSILTDACPGDYVMIGCMGTNGGYTTDENLKLYIDSCLAMGMKVILNSYTPDGPKGRDTYNSSTQTFHGCRDEAVIRNTYEARKDELAGFIDIGKMGDDAFNAYVKDARDAVKPNATSDDTEAWAAGEAAAQEIIACYADHNHYYYGTLVADLLLNGYEGVADGIVKSLVDILSGGENPPQPETYTVTIHKMPSMVEKVWLGDKEAEVVNVGDTIETVDFTAIFTDVEPGEYDVRIELDDFYAGDYEIDRINVNGTAVDKITVTNADVTATLETKEVLHTVEITVDEHVKDIVLGGMYHGVKEGNKITFKIPHGTHYLAVSCDDGYEVDTAPVNIVIENAVVTPNNISVTTKVRTTPAYTVTGTVDKGVKSISLQDKNNTDKFILGTIDGTTATFNNVEDGTYYIIVEWNTGYVEGSTTPSNHEITVSGANLTDAFEVTTTELPTFVLEKYNGRISIFAAKENSGGKAYIATYDDDGVCTVFDVLNLPELERGVETKADNIPDTAKVFIWNNYMQPYDWAWESDIFPELSED